MATKDIFSNSFSTTRSFTTAGALITWSGAGKSGNFPLILNQVTVQYGRSVQPIYPVNLASDGTYRLINSIGVASGQLTCGSIITPDAKDLKAFFNACGGSCMKDDDHVSITMKPFGSMKGDCNSNLKFRLKHLVLASTGFSIAGQGNITVTQPLSFSFTALELL